MVSLKNVLDLIIVLENLLKNLKKTSLQLLLEAKLPEQKSKIVMLQKK